MTAVLAVNAALIAANAILIGLRFVYRARRSPVAGAPFWILLRTAQSLAVGEVVVAAVLYELGHHPHDRLFYLYAVLPTAINLLAEDLRAQTLRAVLDDFQLASPTEIASLPAERRRALTRAAMSRQLDLTAIAGVVVIALALRAIGTAGGI